MTAHDWGTLGNDTAATRILEAALDAVEGRVQYADARLIECEELRSYVHRGADPDERIEQNIGIGVRVLVDGQWGFAARPLADLADAGNAATRALATAASLAGHGKPVELPPRPPASGRYATAVEQDPFAVSSAARQEQLAGWLTAASRPRKWPPPRPASTRSGSTGTSPTPRAPGSTSTSWRPARCSW